MGIPTDTWRVEIGHQEFNEKRNLLRLQLNVVQFGRRFRVQVFQK